MTASPALPFQLEGVGLSFGKQRVLENVSFEVGAGELVALVGPSGAGKTSVLKLLNGSLLPERGRVRVADLDLGQLAPKALRDLRRQMGWVPQAFGLVPNLRVVQNIIIGRVGRLGSWRALRSVLRQSDEELAEVHELLEGLGIEDKLFQRVDSLSGGECQRVAIARALYQQPGALLADEPLSALDPARARETLGLLVDLAREHQLTLITSLHDIQLAREFLPRLVALRAGRVLFDAPTESIEDERISALYELQDEAVTRER